MERIRWGVYPDSRFEAVLQQGATPSLMQALAAPPAATDPVAYLRVLDRLRELQPGNTDLLAAWIPAMLTTNRPAPVHAITSSWPMDHGPAAAWRLIAAQVAQTMGARDEARARFRALLESCPDMVDAWQKYVEFDSAHGLPQSDLERLQALYERATDDYVREKGAFALATAWQRQDPGRAFELAAQAHALKRLRQGAWSAAEVAQGLEADRAREPLAPQPGPEPRPVFVVGLPRSGTTVLTRILGSHSGIAGVGEQPLVPQWDAMVARDPGLTPQRVAFAQAWYRAALHDLAAGARMTVDKLPANAERVGLILATFPDALVVWLERELPDCAMSMFLHDFEAGFRYVDDPADLGAYARLLRQHLQHWCEREPGRVLHLRYEQLVADPERAIAPLLSTAGLDWEPAMLDFWQRGEQIATYSEAQVRRPVHRDAVGSWRRFMPAAEGFMRAIGAAA